MMAGQNLRAWLPVFPYAAPVTFIAAVTSLGLTLALEPVTWSGTGPASIFGFVDYSLPYCALGWTLLIVFIPGVLGHTLLNVIISRISPLTLSVAMTLEPLGGTLLGVVMGVASLPQTGSLLGGLINIVGTILTIRATLQREAQEKAAATQQGAVPARSEEDRRGAMPAGPSLQPAGAEADSVDPRRLSMQPLSPTEVYGVHAADRCELAMDGDGRVHVSYS